MTLILNDFGTYYQNVLRDGKARILRVLNDDQNANSISCQTNSANEDQFSDGWSTESITIILNGAFRGSSLRPRS